MKQQGNVNAAPASKNLMVIALALVGALSLAACQSSSVLEGKWRGWEQAACPDGLRHDSLAMDFFGNKTVSHGTVSQGRVSYIDTVEFRLDNAAISFGDGDAAVKYDLKLLSDDTIQYSVRTGGCLITTFMTRVE